MSDLIDRQAAITIPVTPKEDREYQTYNLDDVYEQAWEDLQKRIEQLPSAQTERKKGHWVDEGTNYLCSECHRGCWVNSNYCPWCGADMRGERDD